MLFINIGHQIPGRKCFAIYIEDGDVFMNVNGNETFDTIKQFRELAILAKIPEKSIMSIERKFNKWAKDL